MPETYYREVLTMNARAWALLAASMVLTALMVHPLFMVATAGAWLFNALYFHGLEVRIDEQQVWVGAKSVPLAALDLATFDRASNVWPWKARSPYWLGANPIWTRDSLSLRGQWDGRPVRVNVGTNHREELMAALTGAVQRAQTGAEAAAAPVERSDTPPPGWYVDPWNPVVGLRWWDGWRWSPHVAVRQSNRRGGR
ncbi:MAG: hypothetical protein JWL70_1790 [Acidimicrobiia bacterium]|nr:hypothetical protein [Acidimicrobiia bacterium]